MKHFFQILFLVLLSTFLLISCTQKKTDKIALKGENADLIVSINFANAPEILEKVKNSKYLAIAGKNIETKIQDLVPQIKNSEIAFSAKIKEDNSFGGANVAIWNMENTLATFVSDIRGGMDDPQEINDEAMNNIETLLKKSNTLTELLSQGKMIGSVLRKGINKGADEAQFFETLKVVGNSASMDVYKTKPNALTGVIDQNVGFQAMKKYLTGKEFAYIYGGKSLTENTNDTFKNILITLTLGSQKISLGVYIQTDEIMPEEERKKIAIGLPELKKQINTILSDDGELVQQFAKTDEVRSLVKKIREGYDFSLEATDDGFLIMTVDLPLSLDEVEKFAPLLIQMF